MAVVCFELRTWVDASTPQRGAQDTKPCQGNGGKAEVQNSEACKEMEADRQPYASFEGDCIMQCAMVVLIPASTQRMSKVAPRLCLLRLRAKCEPLLVQPLRAKREPLGFSEVKHEAQEDAIVLAPQRPPSAVAGDGLPRSNGRVRRWIKLLVFWQCVCGNNAHNGHRSESMSRPRERARVRSGSRRFYWISRLMMPTSRFP